MSTVHKGQVLILSPNSKVELSVWINITDLLNHQRYIERWPVKKMAGRKVNVVVKGSAWEFSNSEKIGKGKYWHSGERSTSQLFSKEEEENQMCLLFSATEVRLVNGQGRKSLQGAELGICLFKIISFSLFFFALPSNKFHLFSSGSILAVCIILHSTGTSINLATWDPNCGLNIGKYLNIIWILLQKQLWNPKSSTNMPHTCKWLLCMLLDDGLCDPCPVSRCSHF